MSPIHRARRIVQAGFPRVSGDEPTPEITPMAAVMFSPHERG